MKHKHRKLLSELENLCNSLGRTLDSTATNRSKFIDRQRAHGLVSKVLYGVLTDNPENEYRADDWQAAIESFEELKKLNNKIYPDIYGKQPHTK